MQITSGNSSSYAANLQALLQQRYQAADADSSGGLSASEFTSLTEESATATGTDAVDAQTVFGALDSDSDGTLSEAEFLQPFQQMATGMRSALLGAQEVGSGTDDVGGSTEMVGAPPPPPPGPPPARAGRSEEADDSDDDSETESPDLASLVAEQLDSTQNEGDETAGSVAGASSAGQFGMLMARYLQQTLDSTLSSQSLQV